MNSTSVTTWLKRSDVMAPSHLRTKTRLVAWSSTRVTNVSATSDIW